MNTLKKSNPSILEILNHNQNGKIACYFDASCQTFFHWVGNALRG